MPPPARPGPCLREGFGPKVVIPWGLSSLHPLLGQPRVTAAEPQWHLWGQDRTGSWGHPLDCRGRSILLHPTPKHPWAPGWGGLNPSWEPSLQLGCAGTSRDRGCGRDRASPAPGWVQLRGGRRGWSRRGCAGWENQFLQDVQILLVPQPSTRLQGQLQGQEECGVPCQVRGCWSLSNTPGKGGPGGSRASPVSAQTLYWIKSLAAGCVLPSFLDVRIC